MEQKKKHYQKMKIEEVKLRGKLRLLEGTGCPPVDDPNGPNG